MPPDLTAPPETDAFRKDGQLAVIQAKALTVTDDDDYLIAGQKLGNVKALIKRIQAGLKPIKDKTKAAHDEACKLEHDLLAGPTEARNILNDAMSNYVLEQNRKAYAEAQRVQAELRAKEETKRAEEAHQLAVAGKKEEAKAVAQAPVTVPTVVPRAMPKVDGVSNRHGWKFRIIDPGKIRQAYLCPNEKAIAAAVRTLGPKAAEEVGGIEVEEDVTIVNR